MDLETGTIVVAIFSTIVLSFAFWIIKKLTDM